jgi:hypothetical protein
MFNSSQMTNVAIVGAASGKIRSELPDGGARRLFDVTMDRGVNTQAVWFEDMMGTHNNNWRTGIIDTPDLISKVGDGGTVVGAARTDLHFSSCGTSARAAGTCLDCMRQKTFPEHISATLAVIVCFADHSYVVFLLLLPCCICSQVESYIATTAIHGALIYQNVNDASLPKRVVLFGIHSMKPYGNGISSLEFTASLLTHEEIKAANSTLFASFNNGNTATSEWLIAKLEAGGTEKMAALSMFLEMVQPSGSNNATWGPPMPEQLP